MNDPLFREEAVREYLRVRTRGELLRISPAWADWVFWLLLATALGALGFVTLARVDHVLSAPAVVQTLPSAGDASGPAVAQELEIVARFSPETRPHVTVSTPIRVRAGTGFPPLDLHIDAITSTPGDAALLAHAPLPPAIDAASHGLAPGAHAVAEIRAGRRTLLDLLLGKDAP